jgi:hypothetical protein
MTVPAYNGFPATVMTVTQGTPEHCRSDARAFTHYGVLYLRPFPSDADVFRVQARLQFIDFKAHLCDLAVLSREFSRRLTLAHRRYIVARFSFLGATGHELTKAARK